MLLVYDLKLKRPGGPLLHMMQGCSLEALYRFPKCVWLDHPTPDIQLCTIAESVLDQILAAVYSLTFIASLAGADILFALDKKSEGRMILGKMKTAAFFGVLLAARHGICAIRCFSIRGRRMVAIFRAALVAGLAGLPIIVGAAQLKCHSAPGTMISCIDPDAVRANGDIRAATLYQAWPNNQPVEIDFVLVTDCKRNRLAIQSRKGVDLWPGIYGPAVIQGVPFVYSDVNKSLADDICEVRATRHDKWLRIIGESGT